MKKMLKFTLAILISTMMVYSPNVLAEETSVSGDLEGGKNCGNPNVTVNTDTILKTNNIGYANCYEETNRVATIELSYGDDLITKEVKVDKTLLERVTNEQLTLVIKATRSSDNKELYTATVTSDEIKANSDNYSKQYYNVTVWLETLSKEQIASLNKFGYNGLAHLKVADSNYGNLKATYKINVEGILENGTYGVIDPNTSTTTPKGTLNVINNSLEVSDINLFGGYIFASKEVHNTPLPTPSTSTSSSNNSSNNTTSKEVVEFKQEIVSQSLSIPSSKYEDVIKDTIASDENLKDKLANGANVVIKGEKAPVSESSQNSFKAVIQGGMILDYVDIKINLQSNNQDYPITNLKDKIELSLTIPPAPVVKNGYYREYYVLREHDGNIERLDSKVSEDGKTITFSSDKFSVYAVGYVDKKISASSSSTINNPKTGDIIYFMISTVIISAGSVYLSIKRMLTNK